MELILVGIVSGLVTGIGMGGGSILILVMVTFMKISQYVAQSTNLIFFIPTAIVAIFIHIKNKNIEKDVGKKLLLPSIIGSGWGAYLTSVVKADNLRKYFGYFLLVVRNLWININVKRAFKRKEV